MLDYSQFQAQVPLQQEGVVEGLDTNSEETKEIL